MRTDVCSICLDEFVLDSEDQLKSPFASAHGCFCSYGHFCCRQDLVQVGCLKINQLRSFLTLKYIIFIFSIARKMYFQLCST